MTCGHCVATVTTAVHAIPGVQGVEIDLDSGEFAVTVDRPVDIVTIRSAVEDAGYDIDNTPPSMDRLT